MNRKEDIIKHLGSEYYLFNSYNKDKITNDIEHIADTLISYQIGEIDDVFIFSEREYLELFKYDSKEKIDANYENLDIYKISYRIKNFNKTNYDKNKGLDIFNSNNTYLLDSESNYCELSDNYIPSIKNVEYLLSKFKTITFGVFDNKPIEWIVLEENENEMRLLSKYVLKRIKLCKSDLISSFKNSSNYIYLNNDFYNNSFSSEEKKLIIDNNGCFISIPSLDDLLSFNTDYLKLLEPCLSDFGAAGILGNELVEYIVDFNKCFVGINGSIYSIIQEYIINDLDDEKYYYGLRPFIIIKKRRL